MYDENDYIMNQIKSMVRGLGKFMGLEQIKELLQLTDDQQGDITDLELETIITVSKLDIILANKENSLNHLISEININSDRIKMIMDYQSIATQDELDQLNRYIIENEDHMSYVVNTDKFADKAINFLQ